MIGPLKKGKDIDIPEHLDCNEIEDVGKPTILVCTLINFQFEKIVLLIWKIGIKSIVLKKYQRGRHFH